MSVGRRGKIVADEVYGEFIIQVPDENRNWVLKGNIDEEQVWVASVDCSNWTSKQEWLDGVVKDDLGKVGRFLRNMPSFEILEVFSGAPIERLEGKELEAVARFMVGAFAEKTSLKRARCHGWLGQLELEREGSNVLFLGLEDRRKRIGEITESGTKIDEQVLKEVLAYQLEQKRVPERFYLML